MAKGYIYIMTNPALKDMEKIGYAANVESRRKQLSTTALPYEYEVYATYETSGNRDDKKLHKMIDNLNPDLRVSSNREFFVMSPQEAYDLLEAIAVISGTGDKYRGSNNAIAVVGGTAGNRADIAPAKADLSNGQRWKCAVVG